MPIKRLALCLGLLILLCLPCVAATPGDLDENNRLDSDDAVYLLYHTLLPTEYPLSQAADYTGDGEISQADAVYLLYHTLLPEDYPLPAAESAIQFPELGYDPDGKGRIQLTDASSAGGNAYFTFYNRSATWVTDESSTITYQCRDADGAILTTGTLHLGYVGCHATVTRAVALPAGTATVTFTGSRTSYWTQWKP
ncbi:MAG: hypothetical protein IJ518_04335 [Clostridia bacterium]|nr:hypothetical protein [Clostridia bacterium]